MKRKVILKLGGSLIEKSRDILRVLVDYARERDGDKNGDFTLVLIPGGGPFAETVRNISATMSIPDETAHWMAVLAMHQYGLFLAACSGGEAGIPLVESEDEDEIDCAGPICILLPYKILEQDDCLPHTWDVTSDTIAAFVANRLGEKRFIKLTDVDGIRDKKSGHLIEKIRANELAGEQAAGLNCIDAELPGFLMQTKMSCIIVNGNYPNRIIDAIEEKENVNKTVCTKIF
ncbi:5-(aminomethyl)-3-furanmethanol phosphate kinase [ANME-1 cluster archaeon GoMg1]|nr:5-(aminomethyl)-3-furanmethanol phosphate kinase [ANME-1 cluster archaeon GoMg1]